MTQISKTKTALEFDLIRFEGLRIRVAGPENIETWSYGEVQKPETINYRTQKPERDGLFDEKIFGPSKDYECYCGKYKRIRYKGVICDKCGVEVTRSSVRRERMGHIDLAVPVCHIWYLRGGSFVLSTLLDISVADLERVNYFASFIVTNVNEELKALSLQQLEHEFKEAKEELKDQPDRLSQLEINFRSTRSDLNNLAVKQVITEAKFHELSLRFGNIVRVGIGADALLELLKNVNLDQEITALKKLLPQSAPNARKRILKRLKLMIELKLAGIKPEWFIIQKLPVLPPDLRPMVQLDGGRFASSDLNDLYRRVINRNNRLKRLMNQGAPDVIIRNEKRMLQEAVDSLIDNSARKSQTVGAGRQPKSLSDVLRGKQGRFRQNLLGKRVDYSGRSVIVVGPNLKIDQCGLPKVMALELFKPFVISRLIRDGHVYNVKNATRLIDRQTPEVWEILEEITNQAHVLLNRAPTLHRLGIQAFKPILIEGKAIQLHPLVCLAYNADFDGDQMAVHVPLSEPAKEEAETLMLSMNNILKPASGESLVFPRLDIVYGLYYMTADPDSNTQPKIFSHPDEVIWSYSQKKLSIKQKVITIIHDQRIETTVGRILVNQVLPEDYPFVNELFDTKKCKKIIKDIYKMYSQKTAALVADDLKDLGFRFAEKSGMTMSINDINSPSVKEQIIKEGEAEVELITKRYNRGLLTDIERRKLTIDVWASIRDRIEHAVIESFDRQSPVWGMITSGARGSRNQLTQLAGMKGLVVNPAGEIIEVPIISNYKEGLSVLEYFLSTHGSRKGKSDQSLRTADAGYLTRRLVDVAQDIVISEEDCGSTEGLLIKTEDSEKYELTFEERLLGRVTAAAVIKDNKTLIKQGTLINEEIIETIIYDQITEVYVRSPIFCKAHWGICQMCYGRDLATGEMVNLGSAVGVMAAQAIGEPGTQLTMKTFHLGGVSGLDITSGLPRVEELFEARPPRFCAILSEISGTVVFKEEKDKLFLEVVSKEIPQEEIEIPENYQIAVKNNDTIKARQAIATAIDQKAIRATIDGKVTIDGRKITVKASESLTAIYQVPADIAPIVVDGQSVEVGTVLTEGHIDLSQLLDLHGPHIAQQYIVQEVQKVYASQGAEVNEKHIEIIVRTMFAKVRVTDGGDSTLLPGTIIDRLSIDRLNDRLLQLNKTTVQYEQVILGVTRAALSTDSWLAAASFQETTNVLIKAAIQGKVDDLKGLIENVIIGKLIPAGTGFTAEPAADITE